MRKLRVLDLYCGAGGSSKGIFDSKVAEVVVAINHSELAIKAHQINHPRTVHLREDITEVDPLSLRRYGCFDALWGSPSCKHHSKAKGNGDYDNKDRMHMDQVRRYALALDIPVVFVENVEEVLTWGPVIPRLDPKTGLPKLDRKGNIVTQPDPERLGEYYHHWVKLFREAGYSYQYRLINSADHGALTSRVRYFGVFLKQGYRFAWPQPSHHRTGAAGLKKWEAVSQALDFWRPAESIFDRDDPLVDNTLERIYAGLVKYVAKGDKAWLIKYRGNNKEGWNYGKPLSEPVPALATENNFYVGQVHFLDAFLTKEYSGDPASKTVPLDRPAGTVTTIDHHHLVQLGFLHNPGHRGYSRGVEQPSPVVVARQDKAPLELVQLSLIDTRRHTNTPRGVDVPLATVTTNPTLDLLNFLVVYNGTSTAVSCDQPSPTVTCKDRLALTSLSWIHKNYGPPWSHQSIDVPGHCLTTSHSKFELAQAWIGAPAFQFRVTDTEPMRRIKEFCMAFGIGDITKRGLVVPELQRIQGFGDDYILAGSETKKKEQLGNAVVPIVAQRLMEAHVNANRHIYEKSRVEGRVAA